MRGFSGKQLGAAQVGTYCETYAGEFHTVLLLQRSWVWPAHSDLFLQQHQPSSARIVQLGLGVGCSLPPCNSVGVQSSHCISLEFGQHPATSSGSVQFWLWSQHSHICSCQTVVRAGLTARQQLLCCVQGHKSLHRKSSNVSGWSILATIAHPLPLPVVQGIIKYSMPFVLLGCCRRSKQGCG